MRVFLLCFLLPTFLSASSLEDWSFRVCKGHYSNQAPEEQKDYLKEQESSICVRYDTYQRALDKYKADLDAFEAGLASGLSRPTRKVQTIEGMLYPISAKALKLALSANNVGRVAYNLRYALGAVFEPKDDPDNLVDREEDVRSRAISNLYSLLNGFKSCSQQVLAMLEKSRKERPSVSERAGASDEATASQQNQDFSACLDLPDFDSEVGKQFNLLKQMVSRPNTELAYPD